MNGEAVSPEELQTQLTRIAARDKVEDVILVTDGQTPLQTVINAGDICRAAGLRNILPKVEGQQ